MGVQIQDYRVRIGTFNQLTYSRKNRSRSTSSSSFSRKSKSAFIISTLVVYLSLFILHTKESFGF